MQIQKTLSFTSTDYVDCYRALGPWTALERRELSGRILRGPNEIDYFSIGEDPTLPLRRSASAESRAEALQTLEHWNGPAANVYIVLNTGWRNHTFWVMLKEDEIRIGAAFCMEYEKLFPLWGVECVENRM